MQDGQTWRPMSEFDPSKPALVHGKLNDQVIDWEPERHDKDYQAGHAISATAWLSGTAFCSMAGSHCDAPRELTPPPENPAVAKLER
jgi:hypothetical protein